MAMYGYRDLKDKIKEHFKFSKEEIKATAISILIFAFIISFNEWGYGEKFDFFIGLRNLFSAILIMTLTILLHLSAQKIAGLHVGFKVEYKLWWYGLLISLVLCILSKGKIWWLFIPGGIFLHHLSGHRLGFFRYGVNTLAMGVIALIGPVANIILATILKNIQIYLPFIPVNLVLLQKVFAVNWAFAVCTLLPIPPLDGSRVFFQSRLIYMFVFGSILGYAILVNVFHIYSFIWALVIGFIIYLLYYILFERKVWKPI